jgi:hypothetical protein
MTLLDVIKDLDSFDSEHVICAGRPWSIDSEAVVGPGADRIDEMVARYGKDYFLEVDIAREAVEGWLSNVTTKPSPEELCEVVIHYAQYDAWPPLT